MELAGERLRTCGKSLQPIAAANSARQPGGCLTDLGETVPGDPVSKRSLAKIPETVSARQPPGRR
jgi:hypothetical protein